MRFNIRKAITGINMIRHGVLGIGRGIMGRSGSSSSSPSPKAEQAKVPKPPKPPSPRVTSLRKTTKGQQSQFRSRLRSVAQQQATTKREKQATGAVALTRWRSRNRT